MIAGDLREPYAMPVKSRMDEEAALPGNTSRVQVTR